MRQGKRFSYRYQRFLFSCLIISKNPEKSHCKTKIVLTPITNKGEQLK